MAAARQYNHILGKPGEAGLWQVTFRADNWNLAFYCNLSFTAIIKLKRVRPHKGPSSIKSSIAIVYTYPWLFFDPPLLDIAIQYYRTVWICCMVNSCRTDRPTQTGAIPIQPQDSPTCPLALIQSPKCIQHWRCTATLADQLLLHFAELKTGTVVCPIPVLQEKPHRLNNEVWRLRLQLLPNHTFLNI